MPHKDPAAHRRYLTERRARIRAEWLAEHGPCVDCGAADELEVDHVDPTKKVSHRVWEWSVARREAELAKCVVRCHDCHVKKTTINREGAYYKPSKLTCEQVDEIRERYAAGGVLQRELADEYGCSKTHICQVLSGKRRSIA